MMDDRLGARSQHPRELAHVRADDACRHVHEGIVGPYEVDAARCVMRQTCAVREKVIDIRSCAETAHAMLQATRGNVDQRDEATDGYQVLRPPAMTGCDLDDLRDAGHIGLDEVCDKRGLPILVRHTEVAGRI